MNISADLFFAQGTIPQNVQTLEVQVNTYTFYLLQIVYTNSFLDALASLKTMLDIKLLMFSSLQD